MLHTILHTRVMEPVSQSAPTRTRARVLFVDQDATVRNACVEIAKTLGYEADCTTDRSDARSRAARHMVDIVVLDMPVGTRTRPTSSSKSGCSARASSSSV